MADRLLRKKPYIVGAVSKVSDSLKITINMGSGLIPGDRVYPVLREDGVLELIPEEVFKKKYAKRFK